MKPTASQVIGTHGESGTLSYKLGTGIMGGRESASKIKVIIGQVWFHGPVVLVLKV